MKERNRRSRIFEFESHYDNLLSLAFIYCGRKSDAIDIVSICYYSIAVSDKDYAVASTDKYGIYRLLSRCADDYFMKKMRKIPSPSSLKAYDFSFKLTDELIALIYIPNRYKACIYLSAVLGLSPDICSSALGKSSSEITRCIKKGKHHFKVELLKFKNKIPDDLSESIRISALSIEFPMGNQVERIARESDKPGFTRNQTMLRFKHQIDRIIPFIALLVIFTVVFSILGVRNGWLLSSDTAQNLPTHIYDLPTGEVSHISFYVFTGDGLSRYNVADIPDNPETISSQMVALGTLAPGTNLASMHANEGSDGLTVTASFSNELLEISENQLLAISRTLCERYSPDTISILVDGTELSINGKTAQDFNGDDSEIVSDMDILYRNE